MTRLFAFTLVACAVCSHASADLILDLRLDDNTRTRSVAFGESVFVDMFLVDTDGMSLITTNGLIGGGGRLFETHTAATAATALFVAPGAGFSGPFASPIGPGIASAEVTAPLFGTVAASAVGIGATSLAEVAAMEIMLARFQVTANGTNGSLHTLTAGALGLPSQGNIAGGFPPTPLDFLLTSAGPTESVTLSVSAAAVPEPSTLFLSTGIAVVFFINRRRKRLCQN